MHHQHKDRRDERREGHHERHDHGRERRDDDYDDYRGPGHHDVDARPYPSRVQGYSYNQEQGQRQGQGQGRATGDYAPPLGPPPTQTTRGASGFSSQGGLERADFLSDAEIDRRVSSGEFAGDEGQGRRGPGLGSSRYDSEYGGGGGGGRGERGRYDAPPG